jgi:hypothetical protein
MSKTIALLIAFFLICALPPSAFATPSTDESAAIDHLITFVRESKLEFIRNGVSYNSADAAEHLSLKYGQAKDRLSTADEFIDNVASKSSLSGKPYLIVFADGTQASAGDWLHEELKKYRETQKKP